MLTDSSTNGFKTAPVEPRVATRSRGTNLRDARLRRPLVAKYFGILFAAVAVPLLANAAIDAYFASREGRAHLDVALAAEARGAAREIESFIANIVADLGWTVQLAWTDVSAEQHRLDAIRVMRQLPAVSAITLLDERGFERMRVSRLEFDEVQSGADASQQPEVVAAKATGTGFSGVTYRNGSEPVMRIAVAGNRASAGIAVAEVNLKLMSDVVGRVKVGNTGHAFILDDGQRVIAHPDMSLVLRGDVRIAEPVAPSLASSRTRDPAGLDVLAIAAQVLPVGWHVVVAQTVSEAFAPLRVSLLRSAALMLAGTLLAVALSYALARRLTRPIGMLEQGARRIGEGDFQHRIDISSGDELQRLAEAFNDMAGELDLSREKSLRIERLKRFLAAPVAELVDRSGEASALRGQRREVGILFADLRGFTALSAQATPETIIEILSQYYEAAGAVVTRHAATLTSFAGDGFMVLLNAPMPLPGFESAAVALAVQMRGAVSDVLDSWRRRGHDLGFGIGLAIGEATVGGIGYEDRLEYTAIGDRVNLAARLCGAALDGQILTDADTASRVDCDVEPVGTVQLKGYDQPIRVFNIVNLPAPRQLAQESQREFPAAARAPHSD